MEQIQYRFRKNDEYFTPEYAVYPIMKRLRPGSAVWCPFDTADSAFVQVLSHHGFRVTHGHIQTGQDFFLADVPECDYIISNPPYSLKNQVLARLYAIGKPFAMDQIAYTQMPGLLKNVLRATEIGAEQNYNQIDGVINNEAPKPSLRDSLKQCQRESAASQPVDTRGRPHQGQER